MANASIDQFRSEAQLSSRKWLVIASPILIVIIGALAARVSLALFGQWAWAATFLVYWGSMAACIALFSGLKKVKSWYGKPRGSILWLVVAILVGISPFPMLLLPNTELLRPSFLAVCWFCFALINGNIEEAYWRGFLFNEIKGWPKWLVVTYSSILFIAIHFLMLGTFATALFNIAFLVILAVMTFFLALLYLRTGSLRWSVLTHILADWGNMNVFVFMNILGMF